MLPSQFSSDHSIKDAVDLANNLNIRYDILPIKDIYEKYEHSLKDIFAGTEFNVAEENIQARARGSIIMALSNKFNWLVLSTGNKTELAMGYCTLYGDMNGGLAVISDLSKTDVYALSNWLNKKAGFERIPLSSIDRVEKGDLVYAGSNTSSTSDTSCASSTSCAGASSDTSVTSDTRRAGCSCASSESGSTCITCSTGYTSN